MGTVLLTYHTYGSWLADDPKGWVQHGEGDIREYCESLGAYQRMKMKGSLLRFDNSQLLIVEKVLWTVSDFRQINLHPYVVHPTHLHVLLNYDNDDVLVYGANLKRDLSYGLTRQLCKPEVRWWSKKFNFKHVRQQDHFDYLLTEYLPQHQKQGARFWIHPEL